jgi:transcriptional regulator with XRE-family HTH domain
MKRQKKTEKTKPLGVLEWLDSIIPDTAEMRAIEAEEVAKYNLAVALSSARAAAGYTQTQLGAKMDVPQSLISRWEHVNHNHTLETLLKLCEATGAKLVMGLEVNGEILPVTPAAECCVVLPEEACEVLKVRAERGKRTVKDELSALLIPYQPSLLSRPYAMRLIEGHKPKPNSEKSVIPNAA